MDIGTDFSIDRFMDIYKNRTLLRFITCGSVDDGKSTLIGRLLYDSKAIFEDQLAAVTKDGNKNGSGGAEVDLALLVDGLQSEREQGITIDVAYRYFSTDTRKFIIADTPGHEQYTRNMVTGASFADLAIVLIDARKGVLPQTKRHSYIASLMGIKHIVVAINKMDLVDYDESVYLKIKAQYESIIEQLPYFGDISFYYIPISALSGDNVVEKSDNMQWYTLDTLMGVLNGAEIKDDSPDKQHSLKMNVQYVNRPNQNFRGFCGLIVEGEAFAGQCIKVLPSGKKSKIKSIISAEIKELAALDDGDAIESVTSARCGESVTLTLEDEIDIGRGDMIIDCLADMPLTNSFEAMVVWMGESKSLETGYIFKTGSTVVSGRVEEIKYKKEMESFEHSKAESLSLNDIALCRISLDKAIALESYEANRFTGGFIIIDRYTDETVGAGMVTNVFAKNGSAVKYSHFELWLNKIIRRLYPHWDVRDISKADFLCM